MNKFLKIFSYLFHPLFIPMMATMAYFYLAGKYFMLRDVYILLIQVGILTIITPILFFWLLYVLKKADSIMVADVNQRKIPLIVQIILLLYLTKTVIRIEYFYELYYCFIASILSTFLAFLLLFAKRKASLHMLGISSLLSFVILMSIHAHINLIIPIAILVFITGAVASSRLVMKAHTPLELVLGFLVGVIPQIVFAYFWV